MTMGQTEERLGFRIQSLEAVSADSILANTKCLDIILKTKERIYDNIVEYSTEGDLDFIGNINDLVMPLSGSFIHMTRRKSMQLRKEKELVPTGGETGGMEDLISVTEEKFVLIIEAKSSSLGQAMKKCLLAMKDMGTTMLVVKVYGFITTGESWRMLSYDGVSFQLTDRMNVIFGSIGKEKRNG
ncbi:hypothetical protein EV426DRAFT_717859 [Tirmania nivea]|nr:hypothetical protein EV426DRAFT_717859 [Tirmania nivea]